MKLKTVLHLILILDIVILAGAAAGQAAAPISVFSSELLASDYNTSDSINNKNIESIFSKNEHLQVKYFLKIIEVSREIEKGIDFTDFFYDNTKKGSIGFYSRDQIFELLDPISLNNLKINYEDEKNINYSIIEPEIIVSIFEKASIEVNEEILNINQGEELIKFKAALNLSLFTENISKDKKIITVNFSIENKGQASFNSTLNLVSGKESLVGFLAINKEKKIDFAPSQSKLFVVYIKAVSFMPTDNYSTQIIKLDGLDNIISSTILDDIRDQKNYISLISGEDKLLKSKLVFKRNFAFYLDYKENNYISLGLDRNLFSDLNLEFNIYNSQENDYFLSLGLNEKVIISPYLLLGAGVYPVVYDLEDEAYKKNYYWAKMKIFILNDKNSILIYYQNKFNKEEVKVEIAKEIRKNVELILANKINSKREEGWKVGLKWKF